MTGGYTYEYIHRLMGGIKGAVEMGSGAIICIQSYTKIGSAIHKLIGGYTDLQTAWRSHKPIFIISK
jgi:hypothetical protein